MTQGLPATTRQTVRDGARPDARSLTNVDRFAHTRTEFLDATLPEHRKLPERGETDSTKTYFAEHLFEVKDSSDLQRPPETTASHTSSI